MKIRFQMSSIGTEKLTPFILLLICGLSTESIIRYVVQFLVRLPLIGGFSIIVEPLIFVTLTLFCIKRIARNIQAPDFLFVLVFYFALFLSMLINADNVPYIMEHLFEIFFVIVPFFFLGLSVKVDIALKKWLYYASCFAIVIAWAYLVYFYSTGRQFSTDSMYEAYALVVHVLIVLWCTMDEPKICNILFSAAGILYLFSMGTRGTIIISLAFICIYLLSKSKRNIKLRVMVIIIAAVVAYIFLCTDIIKEIMLEFRQIVQVMGLSTRIFDSYLFGAAQDSIAERNAIYSLLLKQLNEQPLIGYGLFGEYPYINWSAHNMYLQVCFNFGYPIGILLIGAFIYLIVKALHVTSDPLAKGFMLIWICYIIPQGFFGGNILSYYMFFTIGLLVGQIRRNRNMRGYLLDENTAHIKQV